MTIKDVAQMPAGTKFRWKDDLIEGHLVRLSRQEAWIQWANGNRTDIRDDWALRHVELA